MSYILPDHYGPFDTEKQIEELNRKERQRARLPGSTPVPLRHRHTHADKIIPQPGMCKRCYRRFGRLLKAMGLEWRSTESDWKERTRTRLAIYMDKRCDKKQRRYQRWFQNYEASASRSDASAVCE